MAARRKSICPGESVKKEGCNEHLCTSDSEWSQWGKCIHDCDAAALEGLSTAFGERQRRRFCGGGGDSAETPCSDGGLEQESYPCSQPCPKKCPNDCSGHGKCEADSELCAVNCKVSCTCAQDENGDDMFVGSDCSIPADKLDDVKDENKIMLDALKTARAQIRGDPDCDFYERMNDNLLNVIYDPSLLPDELVAPTFENIATSVETPTYQECLLEEGLALSSQKVGGVQST